VTLRRDAEADAGKTAADEGGQEALAPAPQFPVLDTLRFIGALCVLTTHTAFQSGAYVRHGVWGALLSRLDVGVAIFFVLSGFLLFRPHVAAAVARRPGPSVGRYYWKRFLRIYPVYALAVVIALALIPENRGTSFLGWLRSLAMLDTFVAHQLPQGLTQMWSLAVEVSFYLVLPLLAALSFGRGVHRVHAGRFVTLLVAMTAASVAWHLWLGSASAVQSVGMPMVWLPSYLTWFAVGMGLAFVHTRVAAGGGGAAGRLLTTLGALPGACWAAIAGLMLVAATPLAGPTLLYVATPSQSLTKHLLYAVIGGLVVVTGIFPDSRGRYAAAFSHPLPRHLGHISYSTFCLHLAVLYAVMSWGGYQLFAGHGLEIWVLTLAGSLVASELAYRLIEMPAQRLRGVNVRPRSADVSRPSTTAKAATTR